MNTSPTPADLPDATGLRALASQRLHDAATTGTGTVLSPAAMETLMRMALNPQQAADALVLQQELQLHQIEIDLLSESLRSGSQAGTAGG